MTCKEHEIYSMLAFPTVKKVPVGGWKEGDNWRRVNELFAAGHQQVGICPGRQPNRSYVVIDLDCKNGRNGERTFVGHFRNQKQTAVVRTPNGYHVWYHVPAGTEIAQAVNKPIGNIQDSGIDIRYDKGYVCFGRGYSISNSSPIAPCPRDVLAWLQDDGKKERKYSSDTAAKPTNRMYDLSPLAKGSRNDGLYRWGCGLANGVRNGELSLEDLHDLLHLRGRISGLPWEETELIFQNICDNRLT